MKLPLWLRILLVVAVSIAGAAVGLFGYRYYTHPVTLTVAAGSIDGEASKTMSAIASHLVSINAPVRFKVIDTGTALGAAQAFAAEKADLAVVRGDIGDLSQAGAVVVVAYMVALIIAPPDSSIDANCANLAYRPVAHSTQVQSECPPPAAYMLPIDLHQIVQRDRGPNYSSKLLERGKCHEFILQVYGISSGNAFGDRRCFRKCR